MLTHAVAGLSGFLMKFYDDIVDNPEAYSGLYENKLVIEIVMIACVAYFAHLDPIALIACIITVLIDVMIYVYNLFYPALNLNYAIDKTSWKIGIFIIFAIFIYKGSSTFQSFTLSDYVIIMIGFGAIFMDAISLLSTDKKVTGDPYANMIHLEASNRKLLLRAFAFCGSVACAIGVQIIPIFHEYCHILEYIFTWGMFYFLTSVMSILYLQYQYRQEDIIAAAKKRLTPVKEKIEKEKDD
jgi:hypothetical protein